MKTYQLVHQLLNMVEKFEQENSEKEIGLESFAGYLITQVQHHAPNNANDARFGHKEDEAQRLAHQLENSIGRLFVYMSRYAKSYIKKTLENSLLQGPEDFTCLAILLTHDHLSKTELINRNLQEKTSGAEVIKRLLNAGLVTQWDDDADKRGKRLAISDKGRTLLYEVFKDMNHVGKIVAGNLTITEKYTLHYLLEKLENFHYKLHTQKSIQHKTDIFDTAQQLAAI